MTLSEARDVANMSTRLLESRDFASLPEHLREPVEHDLAALPAVISRAAERISRVQQNVLLSDAGKEAQQADIIAQEESHLDRLNETLEKDVVAYEAMRAKAAAGRFVVSGNGFVEQPDAPPTGDELVTAREIRDRLMALPQAERNQRYFTAVQQGDRETVRAIEHAPAQSAFPLVTNAEMVDRYRLEVSPAKAALEHTKRALELRGIALGHGRRVWEDDKGVLSGRR